MADSKISALTDGGNLQTGDEVAISRAATSYRAVPLLDGWIDDTAETWTYASGSGGGTATFTVAADVTAKLTVGTRIKLTQTTVKYFVVAAVSVASGTTTVTITAGTDYTLANAAISANFHSYDANPQGYPGWFNFAPNGQGFSSKTVDTGRFSVIGRTCFLWMNVSGTSNATTFTATAPINAATTTGMVCGVSNSGSTCLGRAVIASGGATVTFGLGIVTGSNLVTNAGQFTNSGTKACGSFSPLAYEI